MQETGQSKNERSRVKKQEQESRGPYRYRVSIDVDFETVEKDRATLQRKLDRIFKDNDWQNLNKEVSIDLLPLHGVAEGVDVTKPQTIPTEAKSKSSPANSAKETANLPKRRAPTVGKKSKSQKPVDPVKSGDVSKKRRAKVDEGIEQLAKMLDELDD